MASFQLIVDAQKRISFYIMLEESLPDGSKIPYIKCEHIFTVSAAKGLRAKLTRAIDILEAESEEKQVESMVDADLDDFDEEKNDDGESGT